MTCLHHKRAHLQHSQGLCTFNAQKFCHVSSANVTYTGWHNQNRVMQCYAGKHKTSGHAGCQAVVPQWLATAYNDDTGDQDVVCFTHVRKGGREEGRKGGREGRKEGRREGGKEERVN